VPSRMRATGYRKQRSESRHEKQGAPLAISETQRDRAACKRLRAMTISQKLRCGHPALMRAGSFEYTILRSLGKARLSECIGYGAIVPFAQIDTSGI